MTAQAKFILIAMVVGAWLYSMGQDIVKAYESDDWAGVGKQTFNLGVGAILAAMALFNFKVT